MAGAKYGEHEYKHSLSSGIPDFIAKRNHQNKRLTIKDTDYRDLILEDLTIQQFDELLTELVEARNEANAEFGSEGTEASLGFA